MDNKLLGSFEKYDHLRLVLFKGMHLLRRAKRRLGYTIAARNERQVAFLPRQRCFTTLRYGGPMVFTRLYQGLVLSST